MRCKNCGAELNENEEFCPNCGKKNEKEVKKKYCSKCGNEIIGDALFCSRCGASTDENYKNYVSQENKGDIVENKGNDESETENVEITPKNLSDIESSSDANPKDSIQNYKICPVCSTKVSVDTKYCPRCGANVNSDGSEENGVDNTIHGNGYGYYGSSNGNITDYALPMKWYKFLVYFLLFANAFGNAFMGVFSLVNIYVIKLPDLWVEPKLIPIYVTTAIVNIIMGGYSLYVRQNLANYRKRAPMMLYIMYCIPVIFNLIVGLWQFIIIKQFDFMFVAPIFDAAIMIALNYIYFTKRKKYFKN